MTLTSGTRLGPYEVQSSLGAGGMGEVFSARDTRLDRTVAIKILSKHLSERADARERFEREGRAISSLNHPNICQLYDVGEQDGVRYLVMELLEGETLAERLKKGPLTLERVIRMGTEIGDALQYAHRRGIVHRDLKPANIMLTKGGAKILDFGLARSAAAPRGTEELMAALSSPATSDPLTAVGSLVGTFQYMSPEQVEGKEASSLSDIFSFGAVLYEMTTGKRAFEGKSQLSVASAILEKEPEPISRVVSAAPPALEHVIQGCLAKDPELRWQSAGDVARELRWVGTDSGSSAAAGASPTPQRRSHERILWGAFAAAIAAIACLGGWMALRTTPAPPMIHAWLLAPAETAFDFDGDFSGPPTLSADGTQVAFCAHNERELSSVWVQPLDSATPRRLAGTEGASFPFWSRDGKFVAFFADGKLKSVPVGGGSASILADAPNPRGGAWGADDTIVYAPDYRGGLWKVHANQGDAKQATVLDTTLHSTHRWPSFLPDGQHFLFLAINHDGGVPEKYGIYLGSLDDEKSRLILTSDSQGEYSAGYLLFHKDTQLMAQKFDWKSGTLSGALLTVAPNVDYDVGTWHTTFTTSGNGVGNVVLIFQRELAKAGYDLTWLDRTGKSVGKVAEGLPYTGARISPDGKRAAVASGDPRPDIWVYDFARGSRIRLTFDSAVHWGPSWSPDGQRVAFVTQAGMNVALGSDLRAKQAGGNGQEEVLLSGTTGAGTPMDYRWPEWSGDGKYLGYQKQSGPTDATFWAEPLSGDHKPFLVVKAQSAQGRLVDTRLSPDGKWLAYSTTDSGREEVYVTSFPSGSGRWQVSQNGGGAPAWRGDGKELYFFGTGDSTLHAVDIKTDGNEFEVGAPQSLFLIRETSSVGYPYDVAPDGQRFLVPLPQHDAVPAPMSLVVNWTTALGK